MIIFHSEPLTFHAAASEPALGVGLSAGTEATGGAAQCAAVRLFLRFLFGPGGAVWLQQGEPALILLLYEFSSLGERV